MNDNMTLTRRRLLTGCAAVIGAMTLAGCAPDANATPIKVYKSPSCDCCSEWVAGVKAEGFAALVEDRDDLTDLKRELAVPDDLASCHTAVVDRYVIEGHVPPRDIKRLLAEKPAGRGLSVPGMPVGSPGMEVVGEPAEAYTVWLFDGAKRAVFAQYAGAASNK